MRLGRTRLVCFLASAFTFATQAETLFVDAGAAGTNTGQSWANAFTDLQFALLLAEPGDQVWVASATYKPTAGLSRNATFNIPSGVAVFGGFAGTEFNLSQRDIAANPTVLSGDLLGDDVFGDNRFENSLNVVTITDTTGVTLDGLTVTGGHADSTDIFGPLNLGRGGGLWCVNSQIVVRNCRFHNNAARIGGGVYLREGTDAIFDSCVIEDNTALNLLTLDGNGAGVVVAIETNAEFVACTIENNTARAYSAIFVTGENAPEPTRVVLRNSEVVRNSATDGIEAGGAVIARQNAVFEAYGTDFYNNEGGFSGAILGSSERPTTIIVDDCGFFANHAEVTGGAITAWDACEISNSSFILNNCDNVGGAIHLRQGTGTVRDCTFTQNTAVLGGGAIHTDRGDYSVENCVFTECESTTGGAVSFSRGPAVVGVRGCSFIQNRAGSGGALSISQGTTATVESCRFFQNIADETLPFLVDPPPFVIDGAGGAVFVSDLGSTLDLRNSIFSANSATTFGGGMSIIDATASSSIDCEYINNQAHRGGGVYVETTELEIRRSAFHLNRADLDRAFQGVGGAMFATGSAAVRVLDISVIGNEANEGSGGIQVESDSSLLAERCDFIANTGERGGALYLIGGGRVEAKECTFDSNVARQEGGAVSVFFEEPFARFDSCVFTGNISGGNQGGALNVISASAQLVNCLLVRNFATRGGAVGVVQDPMQPIGETKIQSCTIADNGAGVASGVWIGGDAVTTIQSSILYGNLGAPDVEAAAAGTGSIVFSTVGSSGPFAFSFFGQGVLRDDPGFVSSGANIYALAPKSPAIDAADSSILPPDVLDLDNDGDVIEPLPIDLAGMPRVTDDPGAPARPGADNLDQGAYEFQGASCLADINNDETLAPSDFTAWLSAFNSDSNRADLNRDSQLTPADFTAWLAAFNAGCQ